MAESTRGRVGGTAAALMADLRDARGLGAQTAQIWLHGRILARIDDPALGRIAHPGLVLRQVNADLIRLVPAGPCLGTAIDSARAAGLMARLEAEDWLVVPAGPPRGVRLRPDLRPRILAVLFAGRDDEGAGGTPPLRATARAICAAAAAFHAYGPPQGHPARAWWAAMPEEDRAVEAAYHRALGAELSPWFDAAFAGRLATQLGADLDTLPPAWQARVTALLGEGRAGGGAAALPPT